MLIDGEIDEKIAEFQKWIKTQPHMPQNIGKNETRKKITQICHLRIFKKSW